MPSLDDILVHLSQKFNLDAGYEADEFRRFASLLTGSQRFVDIGANQGAYAWIANQLCTGCEIVAIEASPSLSQKLKTETESWEGPNRIRTLPFAAGDVDGMLDFHIGSKDTVGSFVQSDFDKQTTIKVPVKALDGILEPQPNTIFKIDVEGFEYRVLLGSRKLLGAKNCAILIELHGWGDQTIRKYPIDVVVFLYRLGYAPERCSGFHYVFTQRSLLPRTLHFLRYAPILMVKAVLRKAGLKNIRSGFKLTMKSAV